MEATGSGSGSGAAEAVEEDDRIQETAHGGSNSNASSNGDGAPSAAAPPPPRATPFHLEQAGSGADGSSPSTVVDPRKGKDPLLPRDIPPPPSPAGSSSSTRSRDYAAAFRDGVGESSKAGARRARVRWSHPVVAESREVPNAAAPPLDPNMVIQQAADEEANRRREQQARASAPCSCCFLEFLESLALQVWSAFLSISWFPAEQYNSEEAMHRKEQEKLSQVQVGVKVRPKQDKLPHVKGKSFWSRFKNKEKLRQVKVRPRSEKGKSPWSWLKNKIFCREGRQICPEHVQHQTQPITEVMNHYTVCSNGMNSLNAYSEFRPVIGDGECFYRSFIFSYLEQVLDRPDTDEERRLFDVVEKASARHADLGWNSKFSRSSRAFKKLLEKVMRWKMESTSSCRKEELLKFFSTYDKTLDIFAFLRLLVAIQICSHSKEYAPLIPVVASGDCSLEVWCFRRVTPAGVESEYLMMRALASALEVILIVETLQGRYTQDIYTDPGVPRPAVTLLYNGNHYDIIYPCATSSESSSHQASQREHPGDQSSIQQTS